MRRVKIGLFQVDLRGTRSASIKEKQELAYGLAERCLEEGAELVLFPEAYQYVGAGSGIYKSEGLPCIAAAWKERCAELARKHSAYVVPWDVECALDGQRYNTAYILDRSGQEIGRYRKVHLPYAEMFDNEFASGDRFPVFDLDFGRVGIMICFDNYFPESARILALQGAELILYPLYGDTLKPQWELKLLARAADNMVHIASSQIDDYYDIAYTGLVGPDGKLVCKLDSAPTHRVVEVEMGKPVITSTMGDLNIQENLRQYLAKVRNASAYGRILEPDADMRTWNEIFMGRPPFDTKLAGE